MANLTDVTGILADLAAIITACVAVHFWRGNRRNRNRKQLSLENYLKEEKAKGDKGQRGLPHLVAHLGMSESDIMDVAFRSKRVRRVTDKDESGFASKVMLEYSGD
ncbi:MAG: hypothetical protein AABY88_09075 [Pseudomonadota bacterium]